MIMIVIIKSIVRFRIKVFNKIIEFFWFKIGFRLSCESNYLMIFRFLSVIVYFESFMGEKVIVIDMIWGCFWFFSWRWLL